MPCSLFMKEEETPSNSNASSGCSSTITLSSLNRDGSRSAFSPYKPTTVLTNLQRGNVQTQTLTVLPERSIHQLAAQGELFIQTIDENIDVDQKDQNNQTPLMWAAGYGQLEIVRKLLNLGASVLSVGASGENALLLASASGHSAIVRELINHGAVLDYKDQEGNTALMYASYNNHGGCVQELLNAGADITLTNEAFESAFDIAVKRRSKHAQAVMEKHMLSLLSPNKNETV